jgi:hypothetical protein
MLRARFSYNYKASAFSWKYINEAKRAASACPAGRARDRRSRQWL